MTANENSIQCDCGELKGYVKHFSVANRAICYCKDCQAFAHYLGSAEKILDKEGGTDLLQISQDAVVFTKGSEYLACVRLTPKGLTRWYSSCCRTPIGNTGNGKNPFFVGLVHKCFNVEEINKTFGHVDCKANAKSSFNNKLQDIGISSAISKFIFIAVRGLFKRKGSAFFKMNGELLCEPVTLSPDELNKLRELALSYGAFHS